MTHALTFVVLCFAAARITRLLTTDTITERPRTWLLRHSKRLVGRHLSTLLSCPWCTGWWVSALLVAAVWCEEGLPLPFLWPWAVAGGQMLVNGADLRLDTSH